MLKTFFEPHRKSIEGKLRELLHSDLPQVIPFLRSIGLTSKSDANQLVPLSSLSQDDILSIWYWYGVWDPMLQLLEWVTVDSWFKQYLFNKFLYRSAFVRSRYSNKYEMIQSLDKMYAVVAWFTRHLFIAKFVFKTELFSQQRGNAQFLTTVYYRFAGYFSSVWFQLLFHIDINAPTLPLFLDNLENERTTVETVQKCANLAMDIYGPQNFTMRVLRQLRWLVLPESMSNSLKQYSYSRYRAFVTRKLAKRGFSLKVLHISDAHTENFESAASAETEETDNEEKTKGLLSYMIVLEQATQHLYVVFRGTELVTDFYHDMFFSDVQSTYTHISVHAGYYAALFGSGLSNMLSIEEEINKILMENPTVSQLYFVGHSMGGAVASLCGLELMSRGQLIRTPWYDESRSIYHHQDQSTASDELKQHAQHMASINENDDDYKAFKNTQRLFKEYMKLSKKDSPFFDQTELNSIDVQWVTFGIPCFISSLTENKKLQRLQASHPVYSSGYFHNHSIHIVHEYDPIPIMSFGTYGVLKRHFLAWFTKGHLNTYFQPLMITLGSVLTERSLGLERVLSKWLGFDAGNDVLFGRCLMCFAIHQVIGHKILSRMGRSIYNHLNYSSFNELDKINQSLLKTMAWKYLSLGINSLFYPSVFYLMHHGFLDYGIWRSLSLRVIATRFCVSAISSIWSNITAIVQDLYDQATYFPIPNKSGRYLILIPEDDVLYGTKLRQIAKTTGQAYFETMQKAVQPYTWFSMHSQLNYCKCIDRITSLQDYGDGAPQTSSSMFAHKARAMSSSSSSRGDNDQSTDRSRRSSIQMQQQIIAEVSMVPVGNANGTNLNV